MTQTANGKFMVGGVLMDRPFKIRRLGHFGWNALDMEAIVPHYRDTLGFRVSDVRDPYANKERPPELRDIGDTGGYYMRYGSDHHSFVIYNHRLRELGPVHPSLRDKPRPPFNREDTINQITWQLGSLQEVHDADHWFQDQGVKTLRRGRDMPGSNWHTYMNDPDGFRNEIYYGIEQIGWDGHSKPKDLYYRAFHEEPPLPQISEAQELKEFAEMGGEITSGHHYLESLPATYNVQGVLLPRPFKITKIGPVCLFVSDIDASLAYYTKYLGFVPTSEVTHEGYRSAYLRVNTEHHALVLHEKPLREVLGLSSHTSSGPLGMQVANYQQLRDALGFMREKGVKVTSLPAELTPGIDYSFLAHDKDGHAVLFYYYMEQIGWDGKTRDVSETSAGDLDNWPEAVAQKPDTYLGEQFLGPWG